jgi:glycosyltransferase involved in cell wall biosynthesis
VSTIARKVCLVTSANVAANPRLVKEASALKEAGYGVVVVAADIMPSLAGYDSEIAKEVADEFIRVSYQRPRWRRVGRLVKQRAARKVVAALNRIPPFLAATGHHPLTPALSEATRRHRADLYIAHNLAALPAAGAAAQRYNARFGFDAEDYHCGELAMTEMNAPELRIRKSIESYWLPKAAHLTAASPGISDAYRRDYHVQMQPILNVFPLSRAPKQPGVPRSWRGEMPSLYWFSQTIGENRGLEEIVAALACMKTKAELVLRGNASPGYVNRLLATARTVGGDELVKRIKILPVAAPDAMARLSAEHDIGLSVETSTTGNRDICLTNKIFIYLLAGIPVLLSRTAAHTELASQLGSAAILVDLQSAQNTAAALDNFLASRDMQIRAREKAWRLSRERFNWDIEQKKLLVAVEKALATAPVSA